MDSDVVRAIRSSVSETSSASAAHRRTPGMVLLSLSLAPRLLRIMCVVCREYYLSFVNVFDAYDMDDRLKKYADVSVVVPMH